MSWGFLTAIERVRERESGPNNNNKDVFINGKAAVPSGISIFPLIFSPSRFLLICLNLQTAKREAQKSFTNSLFPKRINLVPGEGWSGFGEERAEGRELWWGRGWFLIVAKKGFGWDSAYLSKKCDLLSTLESF